MHPGTPTVFRLLIDGILKPVSEFTQGDVEEFHLFLSLNLLSASQSKLTIPIKISATVNGDLNEYAKKKFKDKEHIVSDAILEVEKTTEDLASLFFKSTYCQK